MYNSFFLHIDLSVYMWVYLTLKNENFVFALTSKTYPKLVSKKNPGDYSIAEPIPVQPRWDLTKILCLTLCKLQPWMMFGSHPF